MNNKNIDCVYLSSKGSCNGINYGMKKPACKYRCPKTIDENAKCSLYKTKSQGGEK